MEKKEFAYGGIKLNGFLMLFLSLALYGIGIWLTIEGIMKDPWLLLGSILFLMVAIILSCGFLLLEPNEARVITFFGKYRGTFTDTGFYWINPFCSTKKLSLRARNLDAEPIKVNDKTGNPVMIG